MQLTEQMVINHLGQPVKREGRELLFQCPECAKIGNDKSKNNLKYNVSSNVLWCFADKDHAPEICTEIYLKNKPERQYTQDTKQWMINREEYHLYQDECNTALMANNKALNYLYEHRLINPFTVKHCGIGYDFEDNKWVFPTYTLDHVLKGFEYRTGDFTQKKIWKEKDTPSCLAHIYGKSKNKYLYIVEGFLDAYLFIQSVDYNEDVTVYTPSNGCGSLKKCISEVNFCNFDKVFLIMDMDEAGQKAAKEVISEYPNIINKELEFTPEQIKLGMNDFTDYWRAKHEQT